jgi:eukaryotic translation initiation factor 2C
MELTWNASTSTSFSYHPTDEPQFYKPGPLPLTSWAVISYDKYTDSDDMKRYVTYLVDTLKSHGVQVDNPRPPLVGPRDPRTQAGIIEGLQMGAREAYKATGKKPQLLCVVLPGRSVSCWYLGAEADKV